MKPINLITFILITVVLATSCKRKNTYELSGVVTNKASGKPIPEASVWLRDDIDHTSPTLIQHIATSDANGKYHVKIESKAGHALLIASKKGYRWVNPSDGSEVVYLFGPGSKVLNLQLEGTALFNSYFQKTSSTPKSTDVVKITLLSYENMNESYVNLGTSEYDGEGPFTFFISGNPVLVLGDRYLRYKLEFSGDGGATFQTKIDSVFLPTSLTEYKETIYY